MELTFEQQRVIGCLVEKERTTPQQYPLTLNALMLACNQTQSRDPVVVFDEETVREAVTSAKTLGLVSFVHPSHGRSVIRYQHHVGEALRCNDDQVAILALLLLRGPQTPGELRTRSDRMAEFSSVHDIETVLSSLISFDPPLVTGVGRQPGQKEDRFAHLLGTSQPVVPVVAKIVVPPDIHRGVATSGPALSEVAVLTAEVAALRDEVATLRQELSNLEDSLGD